MATDRGTGSRNQHHRGRLRASSGEGSERPDVTNVLRSSRVLLSMGASQDVEVAPELTRGVALDDRLTRVFDTHHERIFRLARRLSSSHDDALDLLQETFVRVARAPASLPDGHDGEQAWLIRTLVNLCRDRRRRAIVRSRHAGTHNQDAERGHPETTYVAQMAVERALNQLGGRRRAIVVLHEIEGESIGRISSALGIASATVRWHLFRARGQLRRILS